MNFQAVFRKFTGFILIRIITNIKYSNNKYSLFKRKIGTSIKRLRSTRQKSC